MIRVAVEFSPGSYDLTQLNEFIKEHGDKRITKAAIDYYREPDAPGIVVFGYMGAEVVGVSASKINPDSTEHSITITHRDYRNRGVGSELLAEKIEMLGVKYRAIVASDNAPSKRICEKVGLEARERLLRQRRTGQYEAILFEEKDQ